MKIMMDLCIVPLGVGVSLSSYVAACEDSLKKSNLKGELHAFGTNIEGDWDAVFAAVKRCHEVVHEMGAVVRKNPIRCSIQLVRLSRLASETHTVR